MVIHRVKGISIVNKAEIDVFLELSCFFDDPMDVGNLISGSSAFSKTSGLHIKSHDLHVERGRSWWKLLDKKLIFLSLAFYQLMQLINCSLSVAAAAALLQSCLTLYDPIDGSPPGSDVPGILLARTLEWVAISFSNAWKWKVKVNSLSGGRLLATPWTAAHQAPLSMGFSRQEYWSVSPLPSPVPSRYV